MKKKGKFITFEGIEGCGKSTQLELLQNYLKSRNFSTLVTREPGGTDLGENIRQILLNNKTRISDLAEFLLFSASRNQLVREVIEPSLKDGCIVLSDRFYDSSFAYQGFGRKMDLNLIETISLAVTSALTPDLTIYLKIDGITSQERVMKRGEKDRFESLKLEFYNNVIRGYEKLAEKHGDRIVTLDGTLKVEEIHEKILNILKEKVGLC